MVGAIIWELKDCKQLKQRWKFNLAMCSDHPGASILKEFEKGVALNLYIPGIAQQMHWPVITVKGGNVYS